jgi:hypothetical protein
MNQKILKSIKKSAKSLWLALPAVLSTVLLIGLAITLMPKSFYSLIFGRSVVADIIVGDIAGSVSAGNPITSYIIGGELLTQNVSLVAVTVFIVSWVTVGVVQLPAESMILGRRFAIYRNITAFFMAIVVSLATVWIINLI